MSLSLSLSSLPSPLSTVFELIRFYSVSSVLLPLFACSLYVSIKWPNTHQCHSYHMAMETVSSRHNIHNTKGDISIQPLTDFHQVHIAMYRLAEVANHNNNSKKMPVWNTIANRLLVIFAAVVCCWLLLLLAVVPYSLVRLSYIFILNAYTRITGLPSINILYSTYIFLFFFFFWISLFEKKKKKMNLHWIFPYVICLRMRWWWMEQIAIAHSHAHKHIPCKE